MGYTTEFSGSIKIEPPLNQQEYDFLVKFANTRRMDRDRGPYFVEGEGFIGQANESDIRNYNRPPEGQPGLWCQWEPTEDMKSLRWDGTEKFYNPVEWMTYIIDHFLKPGALAAKELPFLQANHTLNGSIKAQGEDIDDRWKLVVKDNEVSSVVLE